MGAKAITAEEREKIELLIASGLKAATIAKVVGRSETTIGYLKKGTYDQRLERMRKANDMRRHSGNANQLSLTAPREQMEIQGEDPMSDERTMLRLADGVDYTNALLNGIMKRLDALCQALGVGE